VKLFLHDEKKKEYTGYLHTSPEYTMKKMLAVGFDRIFSLCKCFRDYESFGGIHNPEFTMLEWYRSGANFEDIMDDVEAMLNYLEKNLQAPHKKIGKIRRVHMHDLWRTHVGVNLDDYLTTEAMFALCKEKKYSPKEDEPYEDLFYRIFLNEVESHLKEPVIIHHYPAQMAALSELSEEDPGYAQRFELYIGGIELANAFTELTNAEEQQKRLQSEQAQRISLRKETYNIDIEFIAAVKRMPKSGGIALGVDRLVQILSGCKNIDDVLPLPASELFKKKNI
jgi:lysyl-tRNA synthetase class 2